MLKCFVAAQTRQRPFLFVRPLILLVFLPLFFSSQTVVAQTDSIDAATISGTVSNGTSNSPAAEGSEVTLHAYNSSYTSTETITTTLTTNGRFQFNISNKPTDWVYMVSMTYQDLEYSSNIGSLSNHQTLNLPLTIYEPTSDASKIAIDRLHISLTPFGDNLQISELYTFNNNGTAVYTGQSGEIDKGTIFINLPNNAQAPTFERGLGLDNGYFPAPDFFQQDGRWYDTVALRPGPNTLTLLVTYRLPAAESVTLSRALPYPTNQVILALPDNGISFAADGWQQQATQSTGGSDVILSFTHDGLKLGESLPLIFDNALQLGGNGRSPGTTTPTSTNWIISLGILLLVAAVTYRLLHFRAKSATPPQPAPVPTVGAVNKSERKQLLFSLADLDIAFQSGKLSEADYQRQRQEIKSRLHTIWEIV